MYAENIIEQIQELLRSSESLWTTSDIANYLVLSKSAVDTRIIVKPNFPQPLMFSELRAKRWDPVSVREWAKNQQAA